MTAITEHMRHIMKLDRSANAYREVQMRGVRSAVIAALQAKGEAAEIPKVTRTSSTPAQAPKKRATKKKATTSSKRAPKKAPAPKVEASTAPATEPPTADPKAKRAREQVTPRPKATTPAERKAS